jgi:4-amino-4-deoxy-L-arabinose transferase-like glycosyltransferase
VLAKRAWFLLFAAIAAFYLWGLGALPLVGPDEPRYAEVAREMLARRDLITPALGGLPWFEKPPLLYWMTMLSYRVLGVSEYAARLGPAICGLLTAVFIYWLGKNVHESADILAHTETDATVGTAGILARSDAESNALARWSALVWLSSLGAIAFSRGASFDIVLTMTVTGALVCFYRSARIPAGGSPASVPASSPQSRPTKLFLAFYIFTALSLLAKGLIGLVLIFGVVSLYYIIRRERPQRAFIKSLGWGIPLSFVIASVWYGPMIARHGWTFISQFIIQHHFARFVTNKYHHPGPIYFYLPVIVGLALPWTIVLGAALFSARRLTWRGNSALDRLRVFALVWLIFPIAFFSFSGSKLTAYILPVLPAVALLVGERISCFLREQRGEKVLRLTGAVLIGVAAAGFWYADPFHLSFHCVGLAALPLVLVGATAILRPQLRAPLFVLIAIAAFATSAVALKCAAPTVARTESVRDLLTAAAGRGYSTTLVVQLHTVERTAEFYAANRMTYRSDGEPVKLEGVVQVIEAARRNGGVVLCFVPLQYESQLTSYKNAQSEVIADNGRVALLSVRTR